MQATNLHVKNFSPASCHFIRLGPNILRNTPFSSVLSLCFSLDIRHQVSHSHKTTDKILFLYILMFNFSDNRRKDQLLWTEC
jgi:hypothetical protein